MSRSIVQLTSFFSVFIVSAFSSMIGVNADEYSHIDRLAVRIEKKAKQLANETDHYRHTSEYRHLVADTREIARLAEHIHLVTHFEGNLNHLVHDVTELDQKFHHLESVFDQIEHDAEAFGQGHIHGNTAHVKRMLNSIEDSIHHIKDDIEKLRSRVIVYRPAYSGYGNGHSGHGYSGHGYSGHSGHSYRSRNSGHRYGNRGIQFSIGGGSSRIKFKF